MSAKELRFNEGGLDWFVMDEEVTSKDKMLRIRLPAAGFELNRNQAHMLYLYLKDRFEPK